MKESFDVVFIANGAGELNALVRPALEKLMERAPQAKVTIILTPCQYATGKETGVAKNFPNVSQVISSGDYFKWMFLRRPLNNISFSKNGIVVFMGGDLMHAAFISKKLDFDAVAYVEKNIGWKNRIKLFMVPDKKTADKFPDLFKAGRLKVVGNLMSDGVKTELSKEEALRKWDLDPSKPILSFLPGSRTFILNIMMSIYLEIAEWLKKENPNIQLVIPVSPFVEIKKICEAANGKSSKVRLRRTKEGKLQMANRNKLNYLRGNNLEFLLAEEKLFDAINVSDLVVTIPGTNTAEIAALGKPMIMLFPINKAHVVPMEGLGDILTRIPIIAPIIRRIIIRAANLRTKYFALPNIKANEEIIPEIRGKIDPKETANIIMKYLNDKTWQVNIQKKLIKTMGESGASEKIVNEILNLIKEK